MSKHVFYHKMLENFLFFIRIESGNEKGLGTVVDDVALDTGWSAATPPAASSSSPRRSASATPSRCSRPQQTQRRSLKHTNPLQSGRKQYINTVLRDASTQVEYTSVNTIQVKSLSKISCAKHHPPLCNCRWKVFPRDFYHLLPNSNLNNFLQNNEQNSGNLSLQFSNAHPQH